MSLIRNGLSLAVNPCVFFGASVYAMDSPNGTQPSARRGFEQGAATVGGTAEKAGRPNGYSHPYSWLLPTKGGGLSAYNTIYGASNLSGQLAMGRAIESALTGAGTITAAQLSLVVQFAAALSGVGTVSSATMAAASGLSAAISGSGSVSDAALGLIMSIEADITASGGASGSMSGLASIAADIAVTGDLLSTANVADAVWGALAAFQNNPGSMGEQLNNAGASGDPWDAPIEGVYTAGDLLKLISAVLAGKVSGAPTGPVVFRDVNDTTDRVSATVDSSGNRTDVDHDVS
jgi:hypothetical protein